MEVADASGHGSTGQEIVWPIVVRNALELGGTEDGDGRQDGKEVPKVEQVAQDVAPSHDWRTREDPFASVWPEVHEQLALNPRLRGKTLFQWLQRRYPGQFQDGQLRTFQRGVKRWRALSGPAKEVFFSQVHRPGELGASDFTHMSSLGVTIQGQPFEHMVYHFVLTYSNWEDATICFSESFESLSLGLQNALWKLGGSPLRHRTDRMSLAVNNLSDEKEFTRRYQSLMDHYGLAMEKTQAGKGNENGDVEVSHRWFKDVVDQALMLRDSRDFCSREEYRRFLQELLDQQNAGREQRLAEDRSALQPLPEARRESYKQVEVTVSSGSLIRVAHNTYSVHSRLLGERVQVRLHADHLEVWYAQREVERLPRFVVAASRGSIIVTSLIGWSASREPLKAIAIVTRCFQRVASVWRTTCSRRPSRAVRPRSICRSCSWPPRRVKRQSTMLFECCSMRRCPLIARQSRRWCVGRRSFRPRQPCMSKPRIWQVSTPFSATRRCLMTRKVDTTSMLTERLRELQLPTFRESFEEVAQRAQQETLSYQQYLLELAQLECATRRQNRIERHLRLSRLPLEKDLASFQMKRLPAKVARQFRILLEGTFVDRRENILAFGKSGSGKTHLLCALGQELIRQGRKVFFSTCSFWFKTCSLASAI